MNSYDEWMTLLFFVFSMFNLFAALRGMRKARHALSATVRELREARRNEFFVSLLLFFALLSHLLDVFQ